MISHKEFKDLNVISILFKFISGNCPYYLNEVFEFAPEGNVTLRYNFLKLKRLFWNTSTGQKALSFIGPLFWNQIPETLKKIDNLNIFKHNLKKHFFNQMTEFLLTLPLLLILLFTNIIKSSNIIIIITTTIAIIIILLLLLLVFASIINIIIIPIFSFYSLLHFYCFCWGTAMKIKLFACFVLSLSLRFYIYSSISSYSLFFTTKVYQNSFKYSFFCCSLFCIALTCKWFLYKLHSINLYKNSY